MAGITHPFVSAKADVADTSLVRASDWNNTHTGFEWYRTTADITNSTTTPASLTGLACAIAINEVINFIVYLNTFSAALTTGIGISVTGPVSPTLFNLALLSGSSASAAMSIGVAALSTQAITTGMASTTLPQLTIVHGFLVNGSTGGTVQIQFASEVASSLVTVRRGALLVVHR